MKQINPLPGTTIDQAAIELCAAAPASMNFNGIVVDAYPADSPLQVKYRYHVESERLRKEWEASPQGIANRKVMASVADARKRHKAELLAALPLSADGHVAAIKWMCDVEKNTDGLSAAEQSIVFTHFAKLGYTVGGYTGLKKSEYTYDVFCRWLIGQALDTMRVCGTPHQMIHHFAEEAAKMTVPNSN